MRKKKTETLFWSLHAEWTGEQMHKAGKLVSVQVGCDMILWTKKDFDIWNISSVELIGMIKDEWN